MATKPLVRFIPIQEYRASPRMEVRIPMYVYKVIRPVIFRNGVNGGYTLVSDALNLSLRAAMKLIYYAPEADEEGHQNVWVKAPPALIEKAAKAYVTPHTFVRAAAIALANKLVAEAQAAAQDAQDAAKGDAEVLQGG
jgi:hypothetical protein